MSRRMWVLAVGAWLAVVVAGSALTWVAINRAGDQVTGGSDVATTQPGLVSTLGSAPTASTTPSVGPTGPHATASTSRTPTSPRPTQLATPRPTPSAPRTSATVAHSETRTWTGTAGFVTVSCSGRQARLKGASPGDGWSYEVGDASGDSVEVKFERGETEVQVHATCPGGTPEFQVESGGGE